MSALRRRCRRCSPRRRVSEALRATSCNSGGVGVVDAGVEPPLGVVGWVRRAREGPATSRARHRGEQDRVDPSSHAGHGRSARGQAEGFGTSVPAALLGLDFAARVATNRATLRMR